MLSCGIFSVLTCMWFFLRALEHLPTVVIFIACRLQNLNVSCRLLVEFYNWLSLGRAFCHIGVQKRYRDWIVKF